MTRNYAFRLVVFASLVLGLASCTKEDPVTPGEKTLKVGGLFGITGSWATLGVAGNAAAELAVADANAEWIAAGSNLRMSYESRDTKLDTAIALTAITELKAKGVTVFVGPQTSSESRAVKAFADTAGVLVISPSSTAGSLAIAGDNLLRMCPADIEEGPAIAAMMIAESRTHIVSLWRLDVGNTGLKEATEAALTARGATMHDGVSYGVNFTDMPQMVNFFRPYVASQIAAFGKEHVGIYNPGFDEVADIFAAIPADDSVLRGVKWYGGDGTAMSAALLPQVEFCTQTGYPSPLLGIGDGAAISDPIRARIKARCGIDADAYSLSVYDAIRIAARAFEANAGEWNVTAFRAQFMTQAASTHGVTGLCELNAAGDRAFGNFDMMSVRMVGGSPAWVRIGKYSAETGAYTPE